MIERALMEEMLGTAVPTPGVYLHQMPYPCYEKDRYSTLVCVCEPVCVWECVIVCILYYITCSPLSLYQFCAINEVHASPAGISGLDSISGHDCEEGSQ